MRVTVRQPTDILENLENSLKDRNRETDFLFAKENLLYSIKFYIDNLHQILYNIIVKRGKEKYLNKPLDKVNKMLYNIVVIKEKRLC